MSIPLDKRSGFSLLKRILVYTRPYRGLFFSSLLITLLLSGLAIVRPLLISKALNDFVISQKNMAGLRNICLLILFFLILESFLQAVNIRLTNILGQNIIRDLRNQVYRHIIGLRNRFFDNMPVGTLVTRAISDIESLSDVFSEGFIVITGDLVMLCIFIVAMFVKNYLLALVAMSTIPLLFVATALFKRGVKKTFGMVRNAIAALNAFTQEHITGMKIVQLFNKEEEEFEKFKAINNQHRTANIKSIFYYSVFFPVVEILSSVSIALMIWFVGVNQNNYRISLGDLTFFIMMVNMMFRPIRMLADRLNTLQMGMVSAERVFKVLDTDEKIADDGKINFKKVNSVIEFKDVVFAYKEDHPVLKHLNLQIRAGQTVALIGATGAGKSSIIQLLGRFYEIQSGEINIDGQNIKNFTLESLRRNTGVVLQDVYLFNDSVMNNITLHNQNISTADVEQATRQIGLMDYIHSLPGGFDYQVTERGQGLSAGQRQLIAFIRAFVYKPSVFILDEATATIDTPTEKLIQRAVAIISEGRTSIIIAHRLSTIKHADTIFVIDSGEVVEEGSMGELLSRESRFKKLYEMQSGAEIREL